MENITLPEAVRVGILKIVEEISEAPAGVYEGSSTTF